MARRGLRASRFDGRGRFAGRDGFSGRDGSRVSRHGPESRTTDGALRREARDTGRGIERDQGIIEDIAQLEQLALVPQLSSDRMLFLGLSLVGFDHDRQKVSDTWNTRRFRAFYGVGDQALTCLYNNLAPKPDLEKFLMTVSWMKLYETEHVLSGRWGIHENTIRPILKKNSEAIQRLKETKVVWGDFNEDEVFLLSVDGVHCRIQEVRKDPGAKWYDHKSNGPGVAYELGIAIRSNRLVWINGPFPASRHDITTFRDGLKDQIPDGKRAIGDSGYRGEPTKVAVTRDADSDEVKKFKARAKARHETFNARIKNFKILDSAFRHGFERHKTVFEAVCICVQYDIENGHGLFEI